MSELADISWIRTIIAFAVVLALLGALAGFLKYVSTRGITLPLRHGIKKRRMKLVETLPLDARRRVVIVQCDDDEHLLLLGGQNDIVITTNRSAPSNPSEPSSS